MTTLQFPTRTHYLIEDQQQFSSVNNVSEGQHVNLTQLMLLIAHLLTHMSQNINDSICCRDNTE